MIRRIEFRPDQHVYDQYYGYQAGHGINFPVFVGGKNYQRGRGIGSLLSGIGRVIVPLLKQGGKAVLKAGLRTGIGAARDALEGRNVKEGFIKRGKTEGKRLLANAIDTVSQRPIKKIKRGGSSQSTSRRRRKKKSAVNDIFSA